MSDLGSTAGVVALVAAGTALLALLLASIALRRLRSLRSDQLAVIGEGSPRDVVGYVRELESRVDAQALRLDETAEGIAATERRLDGTITHSAVVRYDAYSEVSGRQSSSVALLDEHRNGVVLSSILHREQSRLYAKRISAGESDLGLSPEERAAVDAALGKG